MKVTKTVSVSTFKEMHKVDSLQIVKNPNTEKLFVSANGSTVAAVSKNYDSSKDKEFIQVQFEDSAESIWILHNSNDTNVVESL